MHFALNHTKNQLLWNRNAIFQQMLLIEIFMQPKADTCPYNIKTTTPPQPPSNGCQMALVKFQFLKFNAIYRQLQCLRSCAQLEIVTLQIQRYLTIEWQSVKGRQKKKCQSQGRLVFQWPTD